MTSTKLTLSAAFAANPRSRPIIDGAIAPEGIRLIASAVNGSELFWRQLRFGEFDVSEMSVSSLAILADRGVRDWVALPIFTNRWFSHTTVHVRDGIDIETPSDLAGKRVGVPEYQQTSAVWSRGALQHEFGVDLTSIDWFMERNVDVSHGGATGFEPPPGIRLSYVAPESSIGEMLMDGSLDATLIYLNEPNLVDRSRAEVGGSTGIRPLFPDVAAEGLRYYEKTGVFPLSHCIAIRSSLYERHSWTALNIYNAFVAAKEMAVGGALDVLSAYFTTGVLGGEARTRLQSDPLPYGVAGSRLTLETLLTFMHEQGLTQRTIRIDEIFAKQTLAL
jgi:4,5-dihydroxyphthalate decarboxylase